MSIFQLALTFFIVTNPIGNSPTIIALIKGHSLKRQQIILFREAMFSMILAIFFLFLGDAFLSGFQIQNYALRMSGGILLFLVSLKMIFSVKNSSQADQQQVDPYIVPIATPLLSGAGLMTMIMLYAKEEANDLKILGAILLAWVGVTAVLVSAPYLQILVGKRGIAALEQLMGMLLSMIAMEMIVQGAAVYLSLLKII